MANPEHVALVKQGAEAIAKWREQHPDMQLDLEGVDLRGAKLVQANLMMAMLLEAKLAGAYLTMADLSGAVLAGADLTGAFLHGADLHQADLRQAKLVETHLSRTKLSGAVLVGADLTGANLVEANLSRAFLYGVRGAHRAHGIATVRLTPTDTAHTVSHIDDARYFESCDRPWPERWLDWERLRVVGRLPLFGISYTALLLIPIVFYGLAVYNQQIEQVHTWAEQIAASPDSPLHQVASLLKRLDRLPMPSQSLLLLVSTVLLAIASTLYTWRCPSRIKEFSRDQWCDQLSRSLLHYWPLAWKERYLRLACAACYALGGAGALWVLGTKVWHTGVFIWKHSTWPWPW